MRYTIKPTPEELAAYKAAEMCLKVACKADDDRLRQVAYAEAAELYQAAGSWAMAEWCRESV